MTVLCNNLKKLSPISTRGPKLQSNAHALWHRHDGKQIAEFQSSPFIYFKFKA